MMQFHIYLVSTFGTQVENDFQKRKKKSINLFIEIFNTPHALNFTIIARYYCKSRLKTQESRLYHVSDIRSVCDANDLRNGMQFISVIADHCDHVVSSSRLFA